MIINKITLYEKISAILSLPSYLPLLSRLASLGFQDTARTRYGLSSGLPTFLSPLTITPRFARVSRHNNGYPADIER